MKLITKTNLNFLILACFLFLVGSIIFYTLLRTAIVSDIDNELLSIQQDIENKLNTEDTVSREINYSQIITKVSRINDNYAINKELSDTVLYNESTQEYLLFRQLKFIIKVGDATYLHQVFKSHQNADNLIVTLILIVTFLIVIYMTGLFLLNSITLKKSWTAFYKTLDKLKQFDINSSQMFEPETTDIFEFSNLNKVLVKMTDKIRHDFENLKEYTENTSHELQTPLAVINSKIELLLESENLSENQLLILTDIYNASMKLSRINKSLIYLAMLDKRRFEISEKICVSDIINENIIMFDEFIKTKKLEVNLINKENIYINFNKELVNVLISNLIKNAVKHNIPGGTIKINLDNTFIEISNTSYYYTDTPEDFFKRFKKENSSTKSLGIGLSIVKKICDIFEMKLSYKIEGDFHIIKIIFDEQKS